jgi:uridine phosphorylase
LTTKSSKPSAEPNPRRRDWRHEIVSIASRWLVDQDVHERFPARTLLPLENPDLHDAGPFREPLSGARAHRGVTIGHVAGTEVAIVDSKFGGAAVAMAVDVLAALETEVVVGVGFCGALVPGLESGDLVVPSAALRDESVSARYVATDGPAEPDAALHASLAEAAAKGGRHHVGPIVTTDVATLEDSEFVRRFAAEGALGVDMETSVLLAIARERGLRAATVLVVSDNAASHRPADADALATGVARAVAAAMTALAG